MAVPSKIVAPPPALRTQASQFVRLAELWVQFLEETVRPYLISTSTHMSQQGDAAQAANAAATINALDLSGHADDWLFCNAAGDALEFRPVDSYQYATEAEAIAGTLTNKIVSPLRTKQAIEGQTVAAWDKIATRVASGSTILAFTESDFDSTKYDDYLITLQSITPNALSWPFMWASDDNGATETVAGRVYFLGQSQHQLASTTQDADASGLSGQVEIYNLHADEGAQMLAHTAGRTYRSEVGISGFTANEIATQLQRPSEDAPIDFIAIQVTGTTMASGSATLYGARRG